MISSSILSLLAMIISFKLSGSYSISRRFVLKSNMEFVRQPITSIPSTSSDILPTSTVPTGTGHGRILSSSDIPKIQGSKTVTSFGNPKVIPPGKLGSEWLLWHQVRDDGFADDIVKLSSGRVLFATSANGISNWKYHIDSPVLNPSKEAGDWFLFDSEHVGVGDVIEPGQVAQSKFKTQEGVIVMYLFGGNGESKPTLNNSSRVVKGMKMEIGVAVSQDGAHWSRVEGPFPHGSIVSIGEEGEFDHLFVAFPSVVEVAGEYKMYYHTYDPKVKKYVVGLAVASDGLLRWNKKGPVITGGDNTEDFDFNGVTRRFVGQMEDGTFQMWYEGVSNTTRHSIGIASSKDGIKWTKLYNHPIFTASENENDWDSGGVGSPHLIWLPKERKWRMYYMGCGGGVSHKGYPEASSTAALGVAESTDEFGHTFVRMVNTRY